MASSRIVYARKYLIFLMFLAHRAPAGIQPDLFRNQLHFGYGINYKYNGQLYHNLDRVWVVHRVVIPKPSDLDKLHQFPGPTWKPQVDLCGILTFLPRCLHFLLA